MVRLGTDADRAKAEEAVREALDSGAALKKFREFVENQSGDPQIIELEDLLPQAAFAAEVRAVKPPEPYKGFGIKYVGEKIIRKAGKAAAGSKK